MKLYTLVFYLTVFQNVTTQPDCILPVPEQQNPSFKGGLPAFHQFFARHFQYPPDYLRAGVSGKIVARFKVKTNGQIDHIQLIRSPGFGMNEEVVRVLKRSSGQWTPGKINGKKVAMFYNLPLQITPE